MIKRGLILEGGAMRGMFSAGVIDALLEAGVAFDGIVGVSAGAAFGCNFKSRQPGRALRYNKLLARDWRLCSLRSLLLTGDIFGAEFAYHQVPNHIDVFDRCTYDSDPSEFHVVCTDMITGLPVYQRLARADDHAFEWIRASASMPLCSRIVRLEGRSLLDGGISDSIPLEFFRGLGYGRCVVVLTRPAGYRKKPSRIMPLIRLVYRKYPRFVKAMRTRHEMYNRQLEEVERAERAGEVFVIRPPYPLPIGHLCHDPRKMQCVYDIGYRAALDGIVQLKHFLYS